MPRKIRELRAEAQREGFRLQPKRGKGSHSIWKHPLGPQVNIPGQDGADAKPYMERELRGAISEAQRRVREQQQKRGQ